MSCLLSQPRNVIPNQVLNVGFILPTIVIFNEKLFPSLNLVGFSTSTDTCYTLTEDVTLSYVLMIPKSVWLDLPFTPLQKPNTII